jgi:hypothetical protein
LKFSDGLWLTHTKIYRHVFTIRGEALPVSGAATVFAGVKGEHFVAMNISYGVIGLLLYSNGRNWHMPPERSQTTTDGAIAIYELQWLLR